MNIIFPRTKILHRRNYEMELMEACVVNNSVINWGEMQEIYFAVQKVFDKQDMLNEVSCRLSHHDLTQKEAAQIRFHLNKLVSRYRILLDDGIGENWNDTLCYVLDDFLENGKDEDA